MAFLSAKRGTVTETNAIEDKLPHSVAELPNSIKSLT